jgi:hypothetical protein
MIHKHEIVLTFLLPKLKTLRLTLVNIRKKFVSFISIFARISRFEHFRSGHTTVLCRWTHDSVNSHELLFANRKRFLQLKGPGSLIIFSKSAEMWPV